MRNGEDDRKLVPNLRLAVGVLRQGLKIYIVGWTFVLITTFLSHMYGIGINRPIIINLTRYLPCLFRISFAKLIHVVLGNV
jgi:hypothetical protein